MEKLSKFAEEEEMISVCMTTYNGERFLDQQLTSILQQLQPEDEVLISDDGSSDGTRTLLQQFEAQDARIHLFDGPQKGVIANVAFVLSKARGDILFLADQDDYWLPNRVKSMLAAFDSNPDVQIVLADLAIVDDQGTIIHPSYFALRQVKVGTWQTLIKNGFIGAGMAITSQLRDKALPFPPNIPMHDMWLGMLADKNVYLLKEPLTYYRRHANNVSEIATTASFTQKFRWRWHLFWAYVGQKSRKK